MIEEVLRGLLEVLPTSVVVHCMTRSSSLTKRRVWSAMCCSPCSAASGRIARCPDPRRRATGQPRVGRHDGVVAVVERLKGHPLFGHVTLHRSERSPIAALVTEMLEEVAVSLS